TIYLFQIRDSSKKKTTVSDEDGGFFFSNVPNGYYRLQLSYVGLSTLTIDSIHFRADRFDFNLSDLVLKSSSAESLNEVVIYAEKPLIQSKEGNITFNAGESALSAGSNASELLTNVPLVTKDPDGKLLVRGKEPKILIDDKPVELNQQQLQDLLESLPGSSIEKIEVMTNPPPQYANEQGGVINITTRKGRVGKSGRITLSAGTRGETSVNGNYNYRKQGFAMNINAGGSYNHYNNNSYAIRQNFNSSNTRVYETKSRSENQNIRPNLRANADYEFNKKHAINLVLNYNRNNTHTEANTDFLPSYRLSHRLIENKGENYNANLSLTYTLRTRRLGETLRFIANGNLSDNASERNFYQQFLKPDYSFDGKDSLLKQNINNQTKGMNYRVSYDLPLKNKKTFLSFGAFINKHHSDIYTVAEYKQAISGKMLPLTALTYSFKYHQDIENIRGSIKQRFSETFSTTAGLAVEHTGFGFNVYKTNFKVNNAYWSYLPFATLNKNWRDVLNLTLSYRRTIRRPGYNELSPIVDSSDLFNLRSGNTSILPSMTNNFDLVLGTSKKRFYANLGMGFNMVDDVFNQVRTQLNDSTTQIMWQNSSGKKEYELSTWNGYTFSKKFKLNLSASYTYNVYSGFDKLQRNFKNGSSITSNLNANYNWTDLYNVTSSFTFNRFASPQGSSRSSLSMNLGFQGKFLEKKLTATLSIIDPFRQQQNRSFTYGKNFTIESFNSTRSRNIRLTVGYILNKVATPKKKISEKDKQKLQNALKANKAS
ncbi:MAG TPA: outer membrane beta-barrel protein, partial [Flavisolibacter sp.]|nr:outer membrane beta-barrel protein [Flavisolibacter sp.]